MKKIVMFVLVLPSMADLRQQFIRLHKVLYYSICMF